MYEKVEITQVISSPNASKLVANPSLATSQTLRLPSSREKIQNFLAVFQETPGRSSLGRPSTSPPISEIADRVKADVESLLLPGGEVPRKEVELTKDPSSLRQVALAINELARTGTDFELRFSPETHSLQEPFTKAKEEIIALHTINARLASKLNDMRALIARQIDEMKEENKDILAHLAEAKEESFDISLTPFRMLEPNDDIE